MAVGDATARQAALAVLRALRDGRLLDAALDREASRIDPRHRAFLHELAYGTVRMRGRIDHLLEPRLRRAPDPGVRDVLRLAAYQLLFMDGVPAYAAISESVELVRWSGHGRAAGFVNGVLRGMQRERASGDPPDDWARDAPAMAAWGSHPEWMVRRWIGRWGPERTAAILEANNRRPGLYVTVDETAVDSARARLREAGMEAEPVEGVPGSIRLGPDASPGAVVSVTGGVIQDPAAAAVVAFADVPRGAGVVDLCAAPGGKSVGMAWRGAGVTALDRSVGRLRRVRENVTRTGLEGRVRMVAADGRRAPLHPGGADLVLADVPCSGTGTLRRHPDIRWRIGPEDIAALAALQGELLESAAALVRPGGVLVYATCSLEDEENREQMRGFLERHPEFVPEPTERSAVVGPDADGWLSLRPDTSGFDGAFAGRLRRTDR